MTTLNNSTEVLNYFSNQENVSIINSIKYNKRTLTYHLLNDILITDTSSVTIILATDEKFNGHNHTIVHNISRDGLFNVTQKATVCNLQVFFNSIINNGGGGVITQSSYNFTVINCVNYSNMGGFCGGICGGSCSNFKIEKCINYGTIINGASGGIVGDSCSSFTINLCKNYANLSITPNGESSSGGIVGGDCSIFTICNSINGLPRTHHNSIGNKNYIYSQSSGGMVGAGNSNFKLINCVNNADLISGWNGGMIGQNCYDFTVYKCTNNGDIIGDNCGGIVGYQCGASSFPLMKIIKCVNNGNIMGKHSAGILGDSFFNYAGTQSVNIEVLLYKCINNGIIYDATGTSNGFCGNKCLDTTASGQLALNDDIYTLKLMKCKTAYGSLIGSSCFQTNPSNTGTTYPPRVIKIIDCKKQHGFPYIRNFDTVDNCTAYVVTHKGKKISLI